MLLLPLFYGCHTKFDLPARSLSHTHTHTSTGTVAKRPHNGQVNWQVNRQTHTGKHTHTVTYTCTYPLISMYMCVFLCLCNVIAFNLARAVACTAFYVLHASFHPSPAHPAQPQPRTFHTWHTWQMFDYLLFLLFAYLFAYLTKVCCQVMFAMKYD